MEVLCDTGCPVSQVQTPAVSTVPPVDLNVPEEWLIGAETKVQICEQRIIGKEAQSMPAACRTSGLGCAWP
eukprot:1278156-Amphidinium_carterae.1